MLRLAVLIWIGLISYKIYEVYSTPPNNTPAGSRALTQNDSPQKPAFNHEWKGNTLQKIKAPRNSNAKLSSVNQKNSSDS